jgi:folate-binding protein YgfZ
MSTAQISKLDDFSVIRISGADAYSFLQGQVTCDTAQLKQRDWLAGCHCNAKGKMWASFIAVKDGDDILLLATSDSAQTSLSELNKYGVFAKADMTDDTANWHIYGSNLASDNAISIELSTDHFILLSKSQIEPNSSADVWWQQQILSGRAHLFTGTIGEYVPQMLNLQALDYISFQKGCYMGQEMVARMRYLGKNKRALYLAKAGEALDIPVATDVAIELNGNKRNVGKVILSQALSGETWLQLVLPKDTELTESLYLPSGQTLTLLPLPYQIEE